MKKAFLILAIFVFGFANVAAASDVKAYFMIEDSNWGPDRFVVIDGVAHKISNWSMLPSDFAEKLKGNPKAAEFATLARESQVTGNWLFWGFVVGSAAYSSNSSHNPMVNAGLLLTAALSGGYYFQKAQMNMWKAINTYNGINAEIIPQRSTFLVAPSQDGAFAQLNLTF